MKIDTELGPCVFINLSGVEVVRALNAYLVAHDIHVSGPRTFRVNGELCAFAQVIVDPRGSVMTDGKKITATAQ